MTVFAPDAGAKLEIFSVAISQPSRWIIAPRRGKERIETETKHDRNHHNGGFMETQAKGHPKGLYLLFTVEMWERFSYYGMRAILVLFMMKAWMYSEKSAGQIYGWYTGLVYLTPLIGGYLADRYLGARKCIVIGASLMAMGHFSLAFGTPVMFYIGLCLLIFGNGFFKPNISTTVGKLYGENDPRRDGAFTIFYMGINLGAFFSPLVCGTLGEKVGWDWGFGAAGVGMVAGLLIYLKYQYLLGNAGIEPGYKLNAGQPNVPLTREEKHKIAVIFILAFFVLFFWASFEQAGSSLTMFADESTDRNFLGTGWLFPASWYQSVNPFLIFALAPLFSIMWLKLGKKDLSTPAKMAVGLILLSIGMFLMAKAGGYLDIGQDNGIAQEVSRDIDQKTGKVIAIIKKTDVQVSMWWLMGAYALFTLGELCLSPIGLSLVTKLSPAKFTSLLMGTWLGTNFLANLFSGLFAGNYNEMAKATFFLTPGIAAGIAGIVLLCLTPRLRVWMHGIK